ncbi:MAG: DNA mismatch repair endonuclease MutL, partial [Candidatus Eisenbacteria bacterium]|nr:DNA mismatch repair endonuclease MutL [Candidatus Latescibacterota bacterium]MBD3301319.1 DNA mismatch repair endonuclease MutL [Candidatus Eisenbacteria bacterium]
MRGHRVRDPRRPGTLGAPDDGWKGTDRPAADAALRSGRPAGSGDPVRRRAPARPGRVRTGRRALPADLLRELLPPCDGGRPRTPHRRPGVPGTGACVRMTARERSEPKARVRRLEPAVVAKIAAGEMILRPLSVAKELVENALDAGATRIRLEIRGAADRFLSVSDDGAGMDRDACGLAVERHATSKIVEADDIDRVRTLGFRGEALASIARVARLRIVTSPDGEEGSELVVRGGEVEGLRPAGRARGTTVEVEDLFFNSPVRKRFLRSPAGENRLVQRMLTAYGLVRPDVGFRLVVDGQEKLTLTPADPDGRLEQIHGAGFGKKVLALHGENPRIRIEGWIGIPEIARTGSQGQTILVNGRWVSHPALGHALRQGYGDLIPATKQPFAVLILEIPGESVDVNIHPTKREIRFLDERIVFAEVVRTVREATRALVPGLSGGERGWGASGHAPPPVVRDGERHPVPGRPAGNEFDLMFRPTQPERPTAGAPEPVQGREEDPEAGVRVPP